MFIVGKRDNGSKVVFPADKVMVKASYKDDGFHSAEILSLRDGDIYASLTSINYVNTVDEVNAFLKAK